MVDPYQKGGGASGTFRSPDSLSGLFVSGASTIGEKILFTRRANVTNSRRRAFLPAKDGDAAFFLIILLNIPHRFKESFYPNRFNGFAHFSIGESYC